MANRTVKSQSKKKMSTKYSAISNVVPLSQQMRNTRSPTTSITKQTDDFFDDILGDWDQVNATNTNQNKHFGIGIHNKNNDVSSSSSSLGLTPTPPLSTNNKAQQQQTQSSNSQDRNIYILTDNVVIGNGKIPENINQNINIDSNANYTQTIFDDIEQTMEKEKERSESEIFEKQILNDPNYLPPPNDSNGENKSADTTIAKKPKKKHKTESASPVNTELNPWAHITEAPIELGIEEEGVEEEDSDHQNREKRMFLKHDTYEDNSIQYSPNQSTKSPSKESLTKCCYCLIFVIGIVIGVLLTIVLIRHQAIDANYLLNPTGIEKEAETVIQSELNITDHYRKITNAPTEKPTDKPTMFSVWNGFANRSWTHKTRMPTNKPTNKQTNNPTKNPTKHPTNNPTNNPTNKPTNNPSNNPTLTPSNLSPNHPNINNNTTQIPTDYHHVYQGMEINEQNTMATTVIERTEETKTDIELEQFAQILENTSEKPTKNPTNSPSNSQPSTNDALPLCNVMGNIECNTNRLPLPFDKPLSAQLNCHQNTCASPPSLLKGQTIISGETFDGGQTILDIKQEIPIKCHTQNLDTIQVVRDGYDNNEDWIHCIRISNDDTYTTFPILHITFSLISFDFEQGFDNLFITTQFNDVYDDYAEVWTGNKNTSHRFEPNTWYQNFWLTSEKPNTFAEFCLRLQSDESITGKGFVAQFGINLEIGGFGEWSECQTHSDSIHQGNSACGIGVHFREANCPKYIIDNNDNNHDRFDWNNGTHSCTHKYSNYPLNKFCIVQDCQDIDNDKYAPESMRTTKKWDTVGKYIYNGRSRIDPEYANPFNVIMNTERDKKIDLDLLRQGLQSEIDKVLSRYSIPSQSLFPHTFNMEGGSDGIDFKRLGMRLLSSLLFGRVFTFVTTGSSNTAGHDNLFMSGYPMQLQSLMQVIWNKYGVFGSAFRVRNQAVGGHLGTVKQGPCISALVGTYDRNIDMISWESFMNDGSHISPLFEEIWLRNILFTYDKQHSQPFLTCISTSASPQAGCRIDGGGRYVFNSFLKYYKHAIGVSNYYGQYVCNSKIVCNNTVLLDAYGNEIPCEKRQGNEACDACCVSWHPSPHRHRVMAETFAVAFMQSVLNTIDRLYDSINNIIGKNNDYASYELLCLLERDVNNATFERPFTEPIKCASADLSMCNARNGMWCAISFWPTPKHNFIHRYFIDTNGFYNNDTIDLPVTPLVMRNGGRAPIDHKAQWFVNRYQIGAYLIMKVKVPTRYILIVYPQGSSRIKIVDYYSAFRFEVNGVEKTCQSTTYDTNIKLFCLLDCEKPGKYILNMTIVNETNPFIPDKQLVYAVDEIGGI